MTSHMRGKSLLFVANRPLPTSFSYAMSLLHRSAISARIAKLPSFPNSDVDEGYDETDEIADSLGSLPSPGQMGPPPP